MGTNSLSVNRIPDLIWIVEDNLLVLSIVKHTILKHYPSIRVVTYSSLHKAAYDLVKTKSAEYPDKLILDYDYGSEGNVEYFLSFMGFLNDYEKFEVILHSDTPENKLSNALSSPIVKKYVPKSTDLLPLINAIGLS